MKSRLIILALALGALRASGASTAMVNGSVLAAPTNWVVPGSLISTQWQTSVGPATNKSTTVMEGPAAAKSTFSVDGATTLAGGVSADSATVTNTLTAKGSMNTAGAATFASSLNADNVKSTNNAVVGGTAFVVGAANVGSLVSTGAVTAQGALSAGGAATFAAGVNASSMTSTGTVVGQAGANFTGAVTAGGLVTATNGAVVTSTATTNVPLNITAPSGMGTNYLQITNSAGVVIGYISTNGIYRSQYDFIAQLTTTDITTNTILAWTPPSGSATRVIVDAVAWNVTSSATYGRIGSFKNNAGTVTQIGAVASLGISEEDSQYESLLDTASNQLRVRVAGNTGRTVNWLVNVRVIQVP